MSCIIKNPRKTASFTFGKPSKCEQAKTLGVYDRLHGFTGGAIDDPQERPDGDSGWTFRPVRLRVITPGRARNVEVRPRKPVRKLLQERRSRDRPGLAAADVLDVRDVRLDLFRVLLVERQLPELLADFLSRLDDL